MEGRVAVLRPGRPLPHHLPLVHHLELRLGLRPGHHLGRPLAHLHRGLRHHQLQHHARP